MSNAVIIRNRFFWALILVGLNSSALLAAHFKLDEATMQIKSKGLEI